MAEAVSGMVDIAYFPPTASPKKNSIFPSWEYTMPSRMPCQKIGWEKNRKNCQGRRNFRVKPLFFAHFPGFCTLPPLVDRQFSRRDHAPDPASMVSYLTSSLCMSAPKCHEKSLLFCEPRAFLEPIVYAMRGSAKKPGRKLRLTNLVKLTKFLACRLRFTKLKRIFRA